MAWYHRIRNAIRRERVQADARRELWSHVEQRVDDLCAAGMSRDEAESQARRQLGNLTRHVENAGDAHVARWLESGARNVRLALRSLVKSPGVSVTVILTLALGIGGNSAVFSAIDAVLLRPLPYPEADRLVRLGQYTASNAAGPGPVAPIRLEDWNRLNSTFESLTGYYTQDISELSGELPERLVQAFVSPRFTRTWKVEPALGRAFNDADHHVGAGQAAFPLLISDRFWRRRFNADPAALGQTLRTADDTTGTIIGVMPASFRFRDVDLWAPVAVDFPMVQRRDLTWYTVVGRLMPGVTLDSARANLETVQAGLGQDYPDTDGKIRMAMLPLKDQALGEIGRSLWLLYGSVSLLLLIACTNIAALLLARVTQRRHEIAVRYSLGASRSSIVAQLLSEALVLATAGAAAGLLVAATAADVFGTLAQSLPRVEEITLDWRIVAYTMASAIPVTLMCGLLPALRITGGDTRAGVSESNRTQVSSRSPIQWTLVGAQVGLAVLLLAGAGLLVRSFQELNRVSPGFDPDRVLAFNLTVSYAETGDWPRQMRRTATLIQSLSEIPGVDSAAGTVPLPGTRLGPPIEVTLAEGRAGTEPPMLADRRVVTASYFDTLGIPLEAGEPCSREVTDQEAMVNRLFADRYLNGTDAIGLHVTTPAFSGAPGSYLIRGIVGDAREFGLENAPSPTVYYCSSALQPGMAFLVRSRVDADALADTIRRHLAELEPNRSMFGLVRLDSYLDNTIQEDRLRTVLLSSFALTAILLATLGVYGTLAYFVNHRRREVGLRIALGARRLRIAGLFLGQGLRVSLVGAAAGFALALASGRLLAGMLYGVTATDMPTLGAVIVFVVLITAAASLAPALRASRVDPMSVLREE